MCSLFAVPDKMHTVKFLAHNNLAFSGSELVLDVCVFSKTHHIDIYIHPRTHTYPMNALKTHLTRSMTMSTFKKADIYSLLQ